MLRPLWFSAAILLLVMHPAVQAQPSPGTPPPALYKDRLMDGFEPQEDEVEIAQRKYNATGLPRGYSLEALSDQRQSQGQPTNALGFKASGYMDTLHYGSLSGNLALQNQMQGTGSVTQSSIVLRQIGMPFDGGWRADNALGMVNLPTLDLSRRSPRVIVPAPAMLGITSVWQQGRDFGLVAATGQPGRFSGFPVSGFNVSSGSYGLVAAHDKLVLGGGSWELGGMLAQAQNVQSVLAVTAGGQGNLNAQGLYLVARHVWVNPTHNSENSVQINALSSRNTGFDVLGNPNPDARGLWIDGSFGYGAHSNSWGVFRLEPGLSWLDLPMASDLQGAYARHGWRTRQWHWEASLELLNSITGITPNGYFMNNNVRYQYSSRVSFGAGLTRRNYGIQAQSGLFYTQFANDWGSTRAQVELANADTGDRQLQLKLDHEWSFISALRLSTSFLLDSDFRSGVQSQGQGVAVNADWSIGQNVSLTNSFQGRWSTSQTQYTLNAGLNWRLAPNWSLQSTVYAINGTTGAINLAQSPLTPPTVVTTATQDSGLSIVLRYDESAGRARAPVGGPPGSAAGRLTGSVYLDDNASGRRDASEQGAPNVTVMLDGRFAVNTDAQGRFDFPYISAGKHVLTVVSDNLPLPWALKQDGRSEVQVHTRETTTVDIGATRQP